MNPNERIRVGDRVTIYQRGKKNTWYADFWLDGHRRKSLKTANKKFAVERATKLAASLVDSSYQRPLPTAMIQATVDQYLDFVKSEDRARTTLVKYLGILKMLVQFLEARGITRMAQFTASHFDKYRAFRKIDRQAKTVHIEGIVIKQFFRWAKKRKIILVNPVEDIKLAIPKLMPKPGPSLDQINRILNGARSAYLAMMAILAFTGVRSGELQRLRDEDVDLANNWIHVVSRPGAETKTRQSRKIPIHPRLQAILLGLSRSSGPWFFTAEPSAKFPQGGNWISTHKLNERFAALLTLLKLPVGRESGFTVHSLRHAFETICINSGIPQRVVDAWQGHASDRSMGAVYYRLSDDDSQKFMQQVPFGTGTSAADAETEKTL